MLTLGGGLSTLAGTAVILPTACATTTLRAALVGTFTGSYTMTLMNRASASLGTQTATAATCTVSGGGTRTCTSSVANAYQAGDLLQVRLVGDTAFNAAGNTATISSFLAVSATCN
jgi:hypothetical protein